MAELQDRQLPDWMLFTGKWGEAVDGHPLVYHLLDSAAVAALLWQSGLTRGSRAQFINWLNLSEVESGRLLAYWTCLHDLGKATPSFQAKHPPSKARLEARDFDFPSLPRAEIRHHSLLSQWILEGYETEMNIRPPRVFTQFRLAIGGHHGTFHALEDREQSLARYNNLGDERWSEARYGLFIALTDLFKPPSLPVLQLSQTDRNALFNLLTGFFVAADWVSSQDDLFQYQPPTLELGDYWAKAQQLAQSALTRTGWLGWQPDGVRPDFRDSFDYPPYPLQRSILKRAEELHEPFLMIVEAPTGCGKTEAALMAADRAIQASGLRGCYIAMPTQATSNQMFGRMKEFLERRYVAQENVNLQLAHGSAALNEEFQTMRLEGVDDDEGSREGNVNAMEWFVQRKRALLAPFGVGTVDQTFFSVLRARHSFLRLFGLHRKAVIFDEVHAYDTYMMEIFHQLLGWMRAIGSSVILLSATLPDKTRLELLKAYQSAAVIETAQAPYPRLSINDGQVITTVSLDKFSDRPIQLERFPYDPVAWIDSVRRILANGGCAAIICNTVDRAQEVYRQIRDAEIVEDSDLYLLHARMPFCWRERKEKEILARFGKMEGVQTEPRRGIVVATQIIEQSLDLDFDLLLTDLAPIDLLIQRIGRLHRHSEREYAPLRPAGLESASCWIFQPVHPDAHRLPDFKKDIYVYDEVILQRTFFALSAIQQLKLPADSDALINMVYSDGDLETCSAAQNQHLHELYLKMLKRQDAEMTSAENRLIGDVDQSNVLGGRTAYLREEDQVMASDTRALTRNAILPSVQLVCFCKHNEKTYLLDEQYPLSVDVAPKGKALNHALRSMVSVNKKAVVDIIQNQPRHAPWSKQPTLRNAYPIVFENGKCALGNGIVLALDEKTGLSIE